MQSRFPSDCRDLPSQPIHLVSLKPSFRSKISPKCFFGAYEAAPYSVKKNNRDVPYHSLDHTCYQRMTVNIAHEGVFAECLR